jgi:hypothetical protein
VPPPSKRYQVGRLFRANVNGETVNHGALIWFRDKASADVVLDAFADKFGYGETITMPQGQERRYEGMTKADFFELVLTRLIRSTVIEYRRANAETASVTAELPELPDVS